MADLHIYYNTAFDRVNIPCSRALLYNYSTDYNTQTFSETNDRDELRRTIKVNTPKDVARAAKFAAITYTDMAGPTDTLFYDILNFHFLNNTVCEFTLEFNPFLTYHIFEHTRASDGTTTTSPLDVYYIGGTLERLTPSDNESQNNNAVPEPWAPSSVYVEDAATQSRGFPELTSGEYSKYYDITVCTVDPATAENAENKITTGQTTTLTTTNGSTTTYNTTEKPGATLKVASGTSIIQTLPDAIDMPIITYTTPGCGYYNSSYEKIASLNALGINGAILGRYLLPCYYAYIAGYDNFNHIDTIQDTAHRSSSVTGYSINTGKTISAADIYGTAYNEKIYNIKAIKYFTNVKVSGLTSGDSKTFRWLDLENTYSKVSFNTICDPAFHGRPYAYSTMFRGHSGLNPETIVKGSEWYNPQWTEEGASGSVIADYNSKTAIHNIARNGFEGALGSALGMTAGALAGDLKTTVSGAVSTTTSLINTLDDIHQQRAANALQNGIYTPETYNAASLPGLSFALPNTFQIYIERLAADDAIAFDRFLTKYGYGTTADGSGSTLYTAVAERGQNFCFVKYKDITITDRRSNPPILGSNKLAEQRLLNGLRIWKTEPNGYYFYGCNYHKPYMADRAGW